MHDKLHNKTITIFFNTKKSTLFVVCHLLGDYLEAIKKDFEKASKVYRSNCDDYNYGHSCLKYGNYTFLGKGKSGSQGSPAEAFKYYEKGCGLKNPESCLHSGLMLVSKSMKDEVKRDVTKVRKNLFFYRKRNIIFGFFFCRELNIFSKAVT